MCFGLCNCGIFCAFGLFLAILSVYGYYWWFMGVSVGLKFWITSGVLGDECRLSLFSLCLGLSV